MGLDQYFYRTNGKGEKVEVAYYRKNWGLHDFINTFKVVGNCDEVLLTRADLDKVVLFLRQNPESDIFTSADENDEIELSSTYLEKLGAIAFYENLTYSPNW